MNWITLRTLKGSIITVKEDDVALIVIDPSTGTGTVTFNNSCSTYDIKDNGINKYLCGMSGACPLPDWDPEILRSEILDLKLENDRLKQRDDIMVKFIRSVRCIGIICDKCDFHDDARHCCLFDHGSMSKEVSDLYMVFSDKAEEILERLDNL